MPALVEPPYIQQYYVIRPGTASTRILQTWVILGMFGTFPCYLLGKKLTHSYTAINFFQEFF